MGVIWGILHILSAFVRFGVFFSVLILHSSTLYLKVYRVLYRIYDSNNPIHVEILIFPFLFLTDGSHKILQFVLEMVKNSQMYVAECLIKFIIGLTDEYKMRSF